MGEVVKTHLFFEEMYDKIIKKNIYRKKDKTMSEVKEKKPVDKKRNTLSIYTYLNLRRFGISVALEDGIKINIAWFETNIKFEKK